VKNLENTKFFLHGITCILMFANAYIYHKKIIKDNKDKVKEQYSNIIEQQLYTTT
jgi:hypothetical protein